MQLDDARPSPLAVCAGATGLGCMFGGYVLQLDAFLSPISLADHRPGRPMSYVPVDGQIGLLFVVLGLMFATLIVARLRPR